MPFAVRTYHSFRPALMQRPIALHVIVVADVFPPSVVDMVVAALLEIVRSIAARRAAMQDNEGYRSHKVPIQLETPKLVAIAVSMAIAV